MIKNIALIVLIQLYGGLEHQKIIFTDNYIVWERMESPIGKAFKFMLIDKTNNKWYYAKEKLTQSTVNDLPKNYSSIYKDWNFVGHETISINKIEAQLNIENWPCQVFEKRETQSVNLETKDGYNTFLLSFCEIPLLSKYLKDEKNKVFSFLHFDSEIQYSPPYIWMTKREFLGTDFNSIVYEITDVYEEILNEETIHLIEKIKAVPSVDSQIFFQNE